MYNNLYQGSLIDNREKIIAETIKCNLFSDILAKLTFADLPACEHVLRILMNMQTLNVIENRTQFVINKMAAKDIIMDVLVEDEHNKLYEIEIQKADAQIDHARRMLYYSSTIIESHLPKGDKKYKNVPELFIFYITEKDIWKQGQTCYTVSKHLNGFDIPYDEGLHMFYINAEVDDGSAIANLMKYFKAADPHDFSQGALSKQINYLKTTKEGQSAMCDLSQRLHDEGEAKGRAEGKFEATLNNLKSLMQNSKCSVDTAMDLLSTPLQERQLYKDLLAKGL